MENFTYGKHSYSYELVFQHRKTISLTIKPNLDIVLKCPQATDRERIQKFLKRKSRWIDQKLLFFKKVQQLNHTREYVSGESYLYLGRQYKLVVKRAKHDQVKLFNGVLVLETTQFVRDSAYNKKLINNWFRERAEIIFAERFVEMLKCFDYSFAPQLTLRQMPKRWGSFVSKKKIILNPKLIHASKECIDYVIIHELCHLKYNNHSKGFFNLLTAKCIKWRNIQVKLDAMLTTNM